MPQNAIISADGGGDVDYIDWTAWDIGEQSADYGAVTVGIHRGAISQAARTVWNGTWVNGAEIKSSGTGFLGAAGATDSMTVPSECIRANTSGKNLTIRGIEMYGDSSGVANCRSPNSGVLFLIDCYIESSGLSCLVIQESSSIIDMQNCVTSCTGSLANTTIGTIKSLDCSHFSEPSTSEFLSYGDFTNSVGVSNGVAGVFGGTSTQINCASNDATATAFPNIVISDEFTNSDPVTSGDYTIKAGGTLSANSIGAFIQVAGGVSITATLGTIEYSSNNTVVNLSGVIDVNTTLGAINYTSNDSVVSLSGDVGITATLGAISYSSNDTSIQISGETILTATLGAIEYSSNNTVVNLIGNVDLIATLGAINYSSNDAVVSLSGGIAVNTTLGTIDYTSNDATITLQGQVSIAATLGAITYGSNNALVNVGTGQFIGTVTAGFADDIYVAGFKQSEITVNFKS